MKARIFTVLQFRDTGSGVTDSIHYVAATCSDEAEVLFKQTFTRCHVGSVQDDHFYVTTDQSMAMFDDHGADTVVQHNVQDRAALPMGYAEYTKWILSQVSDGDYNPRGPFRRFHF